MNQEHEFAPGQRVVLAPTQGRYQQTRAATVVRVTRAQVVVQPDDIHANPNIQSDSPVVAHRLAAFAVTDDGRVFGLVGIPVTPVSGRPPNLVSVPPVTGTYKHIDDMDMSDAEQMAAHLGGKPIG